MNLRVHDLMGVQITFFALNYLILLFNTLDRATTSVKCGPEMSHA